MQLLRALLWPLHFTVLVLLAIMAPLYAYAVNGGLLGIVLACMLTSIACKYGFVLLDHAANGEREPPTLDLDMLAPTDQRAAIPLVGAALALWSWTSLGGVAGKSIAVLLLALLPAIMGLVAVDGWRLQAFLPIPVLRAIAALGAQYLLLMAWLAAVALLAGLALGGGLAGVALYALALLVLWSAFALTGMVFYERRFELGFEPSHSPERRAARAERSRALERGRFIDDLYVAARMRKQGAGRALLAARLARVPQELLVEECTALFAAAEAWQLPRVLAWTAEALLTTLLANGQPEAALALVTRLLHGQPQFRFEVAGPRETLQQLALQSGLKELAARLAAIA
jgi:GNAT superfamily N-acetyltransferase